MEIEVKVTATTEVAVDINITPVEGRFPGPPGAPRYRFVFSDDLVLERIDNRKPGTGLPESPAGSACRHAFGIRDDPPRGRRERQFFPEGSMLFQYEGTFMFDAVTPDLPSACPEVR